MPFLFLFLFLHIALWDYEASSYCSDHHEHGRTRDSSGCDSLRGSVSEAPRFVSCDTSTRWASHLRDVLWYFRFQIWHQVRQAMQKLPPCRGRGLRASCSSQSSTIGLRWKCRSRCWRTLPTLYQSGSKTCNHKYFLCSTGSSRRPAWPVDQLMGQEREKKVAWKHYDRKITVVMRRLVDMGSRNERNAFWRIMQFMVSLRTSRGRWQAPYGTSWILIVNIAGSNVDSGFTTRKNWGY